MLIKLTQVDFDNNRITKIARIISKVVRKDLELPHSKILRLVAIILGYSSYYEAKESAEEYFDKEELSGGFPTYFDDHYPPSPEILRPKFISVIAEFVDINVNLDSVFTSLPLKSLEYFKEDEFATKLTPAIIKKTRESYFKNLKYVFDEGISNDDYAFVPCFRRDVFNLLSTFPKSLISKALLKTTVSEFFSKPVQLITETEKKSKKHVYTSTGTYEDMVFKPSHDLLVKMSLPRFRKRPRLSAAAYHKLSEILLADFRRQYSSLPLQSLFLSHRDLTGFYGEFSETGWGFKWKNLESDKIQENTRLRICKIISHDDFNSGEIEGIYWKYEVLDERKKVECLVSGGLYYKANELDDISDTSFPTDDNAGGSREKAFTDLIGGLDGSREYTASSDDINRTLEVMKIMTVSVLEKRKGASRGLGITALNSAIKILREKYGLMAVKIYCAPMQFIDWQTEDDFPTIRKEKKEAVNKLATYLKKFSVVGIPIYIEKPSH